MFVCFFAEKVQSCRGDDYIFCNRKICNRHPAVRLHCLHLNFIMTDYKCFCNRIAMTRSSLSRAAWRVARSSTRIAKGFLFHLTPISQCCFGFPVAHVAVFVSLGFAWYHQKKTLPAPGVSCTTLGTNEAVTHKDCWRLLPISLLSTLIPTSVSPRSTAVALRSKLRKVVDLII